MFRHCVVVMFKQETSDFQVGSIFAGGKVDVKSAVLFEGPAHKYRTVSMFELKNYRIGL